MFRNTNHLVTNQNVTGLQQNPPLETGLSEAFNAAMRISAERRLLISNQTPVQTSNNQTPMVDSQNINNQTPLQRNVDNKENSENENLVQNITTENPSNNDTDLTSNNDTDLTEWPSTFNERWDNLVSSIRARNQQLEDNLVSTVNQIDQLRIEVEALRNTNQVISSELDSIMTRFMSHINQAESWLHTNYPFIHNGFLNHPYLTSGSILATLLIGGYIILNRINQPSNIATEVTRILTDPIDLPIPVRVGDSITIQPRRITPIGAVGTGGFIWFIKKLFKK